MTVDLPSSPDSNGSTQTWFSQIKRDIQAATEYIELRYDNIPVEKGALLVESFSDDPDIERRNPR